MLDIAFKVIVVHNLIMKVFLKDIVIFNKLKNIVIFVNKINNVQKINNNVKSNKVIIIIQDNKLVYKVKFVLIFIIRIYYKEIYQVFIIINMLNLIVLNVYIHYNP